MPSLRIFHKTLVPPSTPPKDNAPIHQSQTSTPRLVVPPPDISPGSSLPSSTSSLTPTPSRGPDQHEPPNQGIGEGRRVMSRLHALFNAPFPGPGAQDGGDGLPRTKTAPPDTQLEEDSGATTGPEHEVKDRNAIKVLIVTWNMGEQLPKGDLAVLLGDVPAFDGALPTGTLPELPTEHKHPYHIVVIAGQECPTDSGVPRGWGGGLMKGVRAAHKKHREEKLKEIEKEKEDKEKTELLRDGSDDTAVDRPAGEVLDGAATEGVQDDSAKHDKNDPDIIKRLEKEIKEIEKHDKEQHDKEVKEKEQLEKEKKAQEKEEKEKEKKEKDESDRAKKEKEKEDKAQEKKEKEEVEKAKRANDIVEKGKNHHTDAQRFEQLGLGLGIKASTGSPLSRTPHSPLLRASGGMSDESSTEGNPKSPILVEDEDGRRSRAVSPSPSMDRSHASLLLHKPVHHPGSKGWSTMLDDWFCGPSASRPDQHQEDSQTHPSPSPVPPSSTAMSPPPMNRSASAPANPSLSPPNNLSLSPSGRLAVPLSRSPLSRALSNDAHSTDSSSASSPMSDIPVELSSSPPRMALPSASGGSAPIDIPGQYPQRSESSERKVLGASQDIKVEMPQLVVPVEERRTVGGEKCYLHLIKERLMGMYLSVYVYKGCEHLIQGVDKDFVTAGLAGGRVGNKGGIGISLKLADHRFLFVNSHLAAHSARVNARLANIAKIKSDLRLDTFLPKDDPLHGLEDLTDRFDTVFWCGDLNFRLDLSRLHAEWLVEKKKYDEALMWDQLRNTMKDEQKNPFPGFEEGKIDFPPTFKYDVWRSVKSTNRELRRSIRRRGTVTSTHSKVSAQGSDMPGPVREDLSHIAEAPDQEHDSDARSIVSRRESDDDVRTLHSRRSFESSVYHSGVPSTAGTDVSDAESVFRQPIDATAYGSKQKALEVAIKSKTKKFLGIVKMDGVFGHSPKRHSRRVSKSQPVDEGRASGEFDAQSRRTSVSSIATMLSQDPHDSTFSKPPETPINGYAGLPDVPSPNRPRGGSSASAASRPTPKRRLTLKRSNTFKGKAVAVSEEGAEGVEGEDDELDETDRREGVYDTSKKQRVPSWCDRVLWKSRVTPDPPSNPPSPEPESFLEPDSGHFRPFNRLSQAFSSIGGHLRLPVTRTITITPDNDRGTPSRLFSSIGRRGSIDPVPGDDLTGTSRPSLLVTSPEASPMPLPREDPVSPHDTSGMIPSPRRPSQILTSDRPGPSRGLSSSSTSHPLLDAAVPTISPPADPKVTFDPAVSADLDRSTSSATRRRANSDSIHSRPNGFTKDLDSTLSPTPEESPSRLLRGDAGPVRRISFPRHGSISRHSSYDRKTPKAPRRTSGSLRIRKRTQTLDSMTSTGSARHPINVLRQTIAVASDRSDRRETREEDGNAFVKFFKDFQSFPWIHRGGVPVPEPEPEVEEEPIVVKKRHQQGEVECLHYGTIDDAGMRLLEGRSDHRPAIFSAAVYVD